MEQNKRKCGPKSNHPFYPRKYVLGLCGDQMLVALEAKDSLLMEERGLAKRLAVALRAGNRPSAKNGNRFIERGLSRLINLAK